MEGIITFNSIDQFNKVLGVETRHPLVSIVDFSKVEYHGEAPEGFSFNFYAIFFKEQKCGDMKYGRHYYDYQDGTLVFLAPNQPIRIENRMNEELKGWALMFHTDLLRGTNLGKEISEYTFFSYDVFEGLHLSERERKIVFECFYNIQNELDHHIDKHSLRLISSNIELFLSYCIRFYERQFITRKHVNSDLLSRFESLLNSYFTSDLPQQMGLPTVKYCADQLHLSPNYLGDLLKKETGKSAQEHIQLRLIEVAKEKMYSREKTISEVAHELGFEYPQYFSRLFKKCTGMTPNEYRGQIH